MQYIQQILFVAIAFAAIYLFSKKAVEIKRNIFLGHEEDLNTNSALGWKNVLLLSFGQKKMFKNKLVVINLSGRGDKDVATVAEELKIE